MIKAILRVIIWLIIFYNLARFGLEEDMKSSLKSGIWAIIFLIYAMMLM